ncbi:hypothetical protein D3C81_341440 [compost metagenome]
MSDCVQDQSLYACSGGQINDRITGGWGNLQILHGAGGQADADRCCKDIYRVEIPRQFNLSAYRNQIGEADIAEAAAAARFLQKGAGLKRNLLYRGRSFGNDADASVFLVHDNSYENGIVNVNTVLAAAVNDGCTLNGDVLQRDITFADILADNQITVDDGVAKGDIRSIQIHGAVNGNSTGLRSVRARLVVHDGLAACAKLQRPVEDDDSFGACSGLLRSEFAARALHETGLSNCCDGILTPGMAGDKVREARIRSRSVQLQKRCYDDSQLFTGNGFVRFEGLVAISFYVGRSGCFGNFVIVPGAVLDILE